MRYLLIFVLLVIAIENRSLAQNSNDGEKELATLLDKAIASHRAHAKSIHDLEDKIQNASDPSEAEEFRKQITATIAKHKALLNGEDGKSRLDRIDSLIDELMDRSFPQLAFRNFTDTEATKKRLDLKRFELEEKWQKVERLETSLHEAIEENTEEGTGPLFHFITTNLAPAGIDEETKKALRSSIDVDSWQAAAMFLAVSELSAAYEQLEEPAGQAMIASHIRRLVKRGVAFANQTPSKPEVAIEKVFKEMILLESETTQFAMHSMARRGHLQTNLCKSTDLLAKRRAWFESILHRQLNFEQMEQSQAGLLIKAGEEFAMRTSSLGETDPDTLEKESSVRMRMLEEFLKYWKEYENQNHYLSQVSSPAKLLNSASQLVAACGNEVEAREIGLTANAIEGLRRKKLRVTNPLRDGIKFHRFDPPVAAVTVAEKSVGKDFARQPKKDITGTSEDPFSAPVSGDNPFGQPTSGDRTPNDDDPFGG